MAEYTTDEERFSALVNFFKDNKNTFLALFSITSISLIFFLSYQSYSSSQNEKAAVIYDAWFSSLASSASDAANSVDHFNQLQEKYSGTGYAQLARIIRGSSLAKEGQFDAIIIGSALPNIEDDLKKLLKVGGKLFVVLGSKNQMHATLILRETELIWNSKSLFETHLEFMKGHEPPKKFFF